MPPTPHARTRSVTALLALAGAAALATSASADLTGISAGGIILEPNPPVNAPIPNAVQAFVVQGFNEVQCLELVEPLTIFDPNTGGPAVLPAGMSISSHFVYFDPAEPGAIQANIGVDAPILGVIFDDTGLANTHALLGRAGLNYPGFISAYGFELSTDSVTPVNPFVLRFTASANNPGDHFRIITECVPTPGTAAIGVLAVLATARRRRH